MKIVNPQSSIDEILVLLSARRFSDAADKWHTQQKEGGLCRDICPFGDGVNAIRCTHCLEGSIRNAVLKASCDHDKAQIYRTAANSIKLWLMPAS